MTQHGSFPGRPRGRRARHQADVPEGEGYAPTPQDEREFPDLPPIRPRDARARDARAQGDWPGQQAQPGQYGQSGQYGQQDRSGYGGGYPAGGAGYVQSGPSPVNPGYGAGQPGGGQYDGYPGGGLAEGLAADRLEITIAPVAAALGGMTAADRAGGAGGTAGGDGDADWDAGGAAADRPRTVRISAVGGRWEGVELPLLGLADRL